MMMIDLDAPTWLTLMLTALITSVLTAYFTAKPASSPQAPVSKLIHSAIKARRSIFPKDYTGEPVPLEVLERCFEAANWAPTHGKTEPWRFVVFSGSEGVAKFLKLKKDAIKSYFVNDSESLEAQVSKASKKEKELRFCAHIVVICVKRVTNSKGNLMPEWEEAAATACAVQVPLTPIYPSLSSSPAGRHYIHCLTYSLVLRTFTWRYIARATVATGLRAELGHGLIFLMFAQC